MKKKRWIWLSILAAVLALCLTVALMFVFQAEIFDRSGWSEKDGQVRYLDYYGRPQVGWLTIDEQRYYFAPEGGAMLTGWQTLEGVLYYFDPDGILHTGWLDDGENWYYLKDDGTVYSGWLEDGGKRCYLGEDGVMHTGWLEQQDGRYYLQDDGSAYSGWLEQADNRYYLDEKGKAHSGWLELPEGRYYLDDSGVLQTGWLELDGEKYYLNDSGTVHTGWLEAETDRYYFRDDGTMARGKVSIDGVNRFFASTGKYVVLVNHTNKVPEDYETELVKVNGFRVSAQCAEELKQMIADCKAAGYSCSINSAYRSKQTQQKLWDRRYNNHISEGCSPDQAAAITQTIVAIPGTSEHQLGLAVDMNGGTATYGWLAENGWKYGFILRYPDGKTEHTGIIYEPWHFRYVGQELAQELYEKGLTMEEYMAQLTKE